MFTSGSGRIQSFAFQRLSRDADRPSPDAELPRIQNSPIYFPKSPEDQLGADRAHFVFAFQVIRLNLVILSAGTQVASFSRKKLH